MHDRAVSATSDMQSAEAKCHPTASATADWSSKDDLFAEPDTIMENEDDALHRWHHGQVHLEPKWLRAAAAAATASSP